MDRKNALVELQILKTIASNPTNCSKGPTYFANLIVMLFWDIAKG